MERALHTGVDWKMPPVSALHRDMELKVPAKPERRGMAFHNPVEPEKKPVVLFPSGLADICDPDIEITLRRVDAAMVGLQLDDDAGVGQLEIRQPRQEPLLGDDAAEPTYILNERGIGYGIAKPGNP